MKTILFISLCVTLTHISFCYKNCLNFPMNFCLGSGNSMHMPLNLNKNLIGWFTFDDQYAFDHSGSGLQATPAPTPGPANYLKGYSAHFNGKTMMTVENSLNFSTADDMTITFWIFLLADSTGEWRTILHKGETVQELTPTIMLWPKTRRLHVRTSTQAFWNEGLESKAIINLRQWTHISVILSGQMVQLYINGNLDNQAILKGKIHTNNGKMYVGKDPWHPGVSCYLDDLRFYNTGLNVKDIQAMTFQANPLVGSAYTTLGCDSCNYSEALVTCKGAYHLCSLTELYSGGYMSARQNGWFTYSSEVWARESSTEIERLTENGSLADPKILKMAICCADK